jgi:hypothetical protein
MTNGGRARPRSAIRNDLYEHQRASVEGDQVDLAMERACVARQAREPETLEVGRREVLPEAAECASGIDVSSG